MTCLSIDHFSDYAVDKAGHGVFAVFATDLHRLVGDYFDWNGLRSVFQFICGVAEHGAHHAGYARFVAVEYGGAHGFIDGFKVVDYAVIKAFRKCGDLVSALVCGVLASACRFL